MGRLVFTAAVACWCPACRWLHRYERHATADSLTGPADQPIFARGTAGHQWAPPFSSLMARAPLGGEWPTYYVMKGVHASRCLPIALVAYRHEPKVRAEQWAPDVTDAMGRWCAETYPA